MDPMNLSIIIVNWNTKDLLHQCLASIYAHSPELPFEIIVVDNASSDGSAGMVQDHFPETRLLINKENVGFARANNQGIQISQGRYVLLLNPDTEVRSGALQQLIDFLDSTPASGGAGARILNPSGTLQHSCYLSPTLLREWMHLLHLDGRQRRVMDEWDTSTPREAEVLLGACIILRREALEAVGSLDESYFMYSEEVDLCYRLRKAGWQLYWVPQAEIVHYGGQSTRQIATEMFLQLYQSKLNYFRKHYGKSATWRYKFILLTGSLVRLALVPLAYLERPPDRQQHLALAHRYWKLMRLLPTL
jgi:GT2 family glycosyltransferase